MRPRVRIKDWKVINSESQRNKALVGKLRTPGRNIMRPSGIYYFPTRSHQNYRSKKTVYRLITFVQIISEYNGAKSYALIDYCMRHAYCIDCYTGIAQANPKTDS